MTNDVVSYDRLVSQCWSRRVSQEKFITLSRQYLAQYPPKDLTVVSKAIFRSFASAPVPSPLLLAYINAYLITDEVLSPQNFFDAVHDLADRALKAHVEQLLPSLVLLIPSALQSLKDKENNAKMSLARQLLDIVQAALGMKKRASEDNMAVDVDGNNNNNVDENNQTLQTCADILGALFMDESLQQIIKNEHDEMAIELIARVRPIYDHLIARQKMQYSSLQTILGPYLSVNNELGGGEVKEESFPMPGPCTLNDMAADNADQLLVTPSLSVLILTYYSVTVPFCISYDELLKRFTRMYYLQYASGLRTFLGEIIMAAFIGLLDSVSRRKTDPSYPNKDIIWQSYIMGDLPRLIAELLENEPITQRDKIMEVTLMAVFKYKGVIKAVINITEPNPTTGLGYLVGFLQSCTNLSLASPEFCQEFLLPPDINVDDVIMQEFPCTHGEATLEEVIGSLREDSSERNILSVLELLKPTVEQKNHVELIIKLLLALAKEYDVQLLASVSKILMARPKYLEIVFHHEKYNRLIPGLRSLVDSWSIDDDISGDSQSAYESYGTILKIVYFCTLQFSLHDFRSDALGTEDGFFSNWLSTPARVHNLDKLDMATKDVIDKWILALFDSDGISDDLIKSTRPQDLMRVTPTIIHQCLVACKAGVIDLDAMKGALNYFLQPFLSYTLLSAVLYLCSEIVQTANNVLGRVALETLSSLASSSSFPSSVFWLLRRQVKDALEIRMTVISDPEETETLTTLLEKVEIAVGEWPKIDREVPFSSPSTLQEGLKSLIASVGAGIPELSRHNDNDEGIVPWDPSEISYQGLPDLTLASDFLHVFGPRAFVETLIREALSSPLSMALVQETNTLSQVDSLSFSPPLIVFASMLLTMPLIYSRNYNWHPLNLVRILFMKTLPSLSIPSSNAMNMAGEMTSASPAFIQGRLVGSLLIHIIFGFLTPSQRLDDMTLIDHVQREGDRRRSHADPNCMANGATTDMSSLMYADEEWRGFVDAMQLCEWNQIVWDRCLPIDLKNYIQSLRGT